MKHFYSYSIICLLLSAKAFGQGSDTAISLDLLRAPSSPAANLLGIAPSDVEKPSDASAFMVSLRQATSNFSQLPKSYAVDIAPGLFNTHNLTIDKYSRNDFWNNFRQSVVLSAAIRSLEAGEEDSLSLPKTQLGMGFKFSVLRGSVTDDGLRMLDKIVNLQRRLLNGLDAELESAANADTVYLNARAIMHQIFIRLPRDSVTGTVINSLEFLQWQNIATQRKEFLSQQLLDKRQDELAGLKKLAADFKMTRTGWKLDIAGGIALDFLEQRFTNSRVSKAGGWITGGYETTGGWTWLAIARWLYQPDKIFADEKGLLGSANVQSFDGGGRLVYQPPQGKFSLSSELIYRSVLNKSTVPSSWRWSVNADYDIGHNQKLTFVFGRDFDGTVTRGGNVIAALNFLVGLGNNKTIK